MSLKNINETIWLISKRSSGGIGLNDLSKMPFYEFMEYKFILEKEIKAEQNQNEDMTNNYNRQLGKVNMPKPKFK